MALFEELAEQLKKATEAGQLRYDKARDSATGEGERYEEGSVALVFLRCLREGLRFALSANDAAGGKFDDVVLFWKNEDRMSALFVQLKYKTSAKHTTIRRSDLMWRRKDKTKEKSRDKKNDFSLNMYHDSYKEMRDSLDDGSYALVLCTHLDIQKNARHMFVERNPESVPGMKLLDSGGCLYSLNSDDDDVKCAVEGDQQFIENFYLFCNQSNNESIKYEIRREIKEILGADEKYCETVCEKLYTCLRKWMNTEDVRLTSNWDSWLNMVDTYVKEKVTSCNSLVTRIKYRCVEALHKHIQDCNPAWIRPPGEEATVLSATKVHQAVCGEGHIMVSVARLRELQEKILCCWGPFCRWLVGVTIACSEMSTDQYNEILDEAGRNYHQQVATLLGNRILDMMKKSTSTGSPKPKLQHGSNQLKTCRQLPLHESWLDSSTFQIYAAAATGDVDRIKWLIFAGVDVNRKFMGIVTPLHCAAVAGRTQSVRQLLDAGADPLALDYEGCTALHRAAIGGNAECVRLLSSAVQTLDVTNLTGSTALFYATQNGDDESVKHLLRAGAYSSPVDREMDAPLHVAALRGNAECVRLLLQGKADVAARDAGGRSALHLAAQSSNPDCVGQLLEAGAGVQERDRDGITPLHYAAARGSPASVSLLVRKGADVHERDLGGHTPLHYAALHGKAHSVKRLLDAGADALAQNSVRWTPLHMAAARNNAVCLIQLICAVWDRHRESK